MAEEKEEVKRLNYFKGLFLQAEDFSAEQEYHIRMRRLHNRALHTWGVVEGLDVKQVTGTNSVTVTAGTAIDNKGQEIVLPTPGWPSTAVSVVSTGDVYITISYAEADDEKYTTAGVEGEKFKRKVERPVVKQDPAAPGADSPAVLLAKVSLQNGAITNIDNTVRRLAGTAASDLEVKGLKWGNNSRLQADMGGSIELGGDNSTKGVGTPYIDFHFGPKPVAEDFNTRIINDGDGRLSIRAAVLQATGNVGIGTETPGARLTVQQGAPITGTAPNGKGLFVSALMGAGAASDGGIEFRHENLSQGIGFGYNTIYATGSNANQDLSIQSRGTGSVLLNPSAGNVGIGSASPPNAKLQVSGGAIMPAAGNTEASGIMFPKDPGKGTGDAAWIRYYARTGEAQTENTTLEIGTSNDPQDHIALMASGNVGIGTTTPSETLEVNGRIKSGALSIGPWPADARFMFVGTNALDQSNAGNYALLQGAAADKGVTFLNSPEAIRFRIGNVDRMILTKDGNVGIGTVDPKAKLEVSGGDIRWGNGSRLQADQGGSIELGGDNSTPGAGTPYIDFHFKGKTEDFNARIINDGDGRLSVAVPTFTVSRELRSPMFNVTQVFSEKQGGLPLSETFKSGGGTLLIFASGSGWTKTAGGIGMAIQIDNATKGSAFIFTNEPNSHKAFVANALVVPGIAEGQHSLSLVVAPEFPGTIADFNDRFSVTILELPWVTLAGRIPIVVGPPIVVDPRIIVPPIA